MPFEPPSWSPPLPELPDSVTVEQFMLDDAYGRYTLGYSRNPWTCGLTGKTYGPLEVLERVEHLARALCKEFDVEPNKGSEWDKVIGIFSSNTIDYIPTCWATHRIGGILTAANAAYNADELAYQLKNSGAKGIFTCLPLLKTTLDACKQVGIPKEKVFILPMPPQFTQGMSAPGYKTVDDLIKAGSKLPRQDRYHMKKGEGAKRCAFLCYSSGTSGLPKGVMISHRNVIANTVQMNVHESSLREEMKKAANDDHYTENCLGLLPYSHIYGLIVINHVGPYRGDGVIVMPKYDLTQLLQATQEHKIAMWYLVPPMIIHLTKQPELAAKYDLSSVHSAFTGAAPLGKETAEEMSRVMPQMALRQGYGMTETCTVVCSTVPNDIWFGSSGPLLPGYKARIITVEGEELTGYQQRGELVVQSPTVVLGYLNNEKADKETFVELEDGRYMKTGDEAMIDKSPQGHEHVFITDRIKELIKVKGNQVAPAELEAHLLTHPAVDDCVVIGVPSEREGEVPKAFVVKSAGAKGSDEQLMEDIASHVQKHKTDYKRLRGGVEFIDVVPKSPSGKILRRMLRDQERDKRRKQGAKL